MATSVRKIKTPVQDLRERFNTDIQPHIVSGLYQLNEISSGTPSKASNQPPGTRSVMFEILNQHGRVIAKAHAFVLPNGAYGASGLLDPKHIRVGNTHYSL